ncbi:MAG: acyltransferase [Steroidobacteraceae bacterium]
MHDKGRTFIALDGLRGVAALCVVFLHIFRFTGEWKLPTAYLAVDLFFVLSGFVLAHAYERAFRRGLSPGRFMVQRLIRLYPLYLIGTALGVLVVVLSIRFGSGGSALLWTWDRVWKALPYGLFMVPCPPGVEYTMFPFNTVMWSIFFELVVNLLWALTWRFLESMQILVIVVAIAGVGLIVAWNTWGVLNLGLTWASFIGGLARVLYSFPMGILLYRAYQRWKLPALPSFLLLLALPLLFLIPRATPMELMTALFILPGIVLLAAYSRPAGALAVVCSYLGEASYAIYAVHKKVYDLSYAAILKAFDIRAEALAPWITLPFIVGLIATCILLSRVFDEPIRRGLSTAAFGARRDR